MDFNKFRCDGTIRATFILPSVSLSWSIFTSVFSLEFLQKWLYFSASGHTSAITNSTSMRLYFPPWLPLPSLYLLLGLFSIFFLSMPSGKRRALFTHTHTTARKGLSFLWRKKNDSRDDIWIEIDKVNLYSQRKTQKKIFNSVFICMLLNNVSKSCGRIYQAFSSITDQSLPL